ncbi:MAG TPA: hypothetical protein VG895_03640 [Patescibacteria group bacterium]|nr:hypothetical protein [Patescibacteria group bacterium]
MSAERNEPVLEFTSLQEATNQTLDHLDNIDESRIRKIFKIESKYQKAKRLIGDNNWTAAQNIIKQELEKSANVLELARTFTAFPDKHIPIDTNSFILKEAAYYGILSWMIDKHIKTNNLPRRPQLMDSLYHLSIPIIIREYGDSFINWPTERSLKELSSLYNDIFK